MALETIMLGIGVLFLLALLYAAFIYNSFISLKTKIDRSWAQIDVFLKRRYDLIPNLVEAVKGYKNYERDLLTDLTRTRSELVTGSVGERAKANATVSKNLKSLFAVAENYPNLKANENFLKLQEELVATENSIAFVRIAYNDTVTEYTVSLRSFPSSVFANLFGFKPRELFQASEQERESIKLNIEE